MNKLLFLKRMEELLEVAPGTLQETTKLAETPAWDSLALLGFIAMADTEMNTQLNISDIIKSQTFADLYDFLGQ